MNPLLLNRMYAVVQVNQMSVNSSRDHHPPVGLDTNIPKFGLNIFREILEKSSKYLQKALKSPKIS